MITIENIFDYAVETFPDCNVDTNWGEKGLFYNKDDKLKKGVYVFTIKEKDGANDKASELGRQEGMYRLSICVTKPTFLKMFGFIPQRQKAGEVVDMDYDFSKIDVITPHPVYAWQCWISIINPSKESFENLKPYLREAHILAKDRFASRNE